MSAPVHVFLSEALGRYGFPEGHPLSIDRQGAFWNAACARGLDRTVVVADYAMAARGAIERFHHPGYVERVIAASGAGSGYLDSGDTPAFPGCYEVAAHLVGAALEGARRVVSGAARRTFQPIGGLHHARRGAAAGFCVFNDLGVLIETLRTEHGVRRIAYVDIDVHHGDGVFYEFENDAELIVADLHEDGAYLYPGTGRAEETGRGAARGTKLNLPLARGAGDAEFFAAWDEAERFLERQAPEFFILQCGADGLAGDPLADLRLTPAAHTHVARRLIALAARHARGRLMVFGGGGYSLENLSMAWCAVLETLALD
ncbi:MAG: acetoin utilization protein AcuC [Betaproteobacteria bacterium]|nr:MAG: acetoin utilization protein AcuC [Betaproteobacteria bacterium]